MTVLLDRSRSRAEALWSERSPQLPSVVRISTARANEGATWTPIAQAGESFALTETVKLLDALDVGSAVRSEVRRFLVLVLGRDATIPVVTPGDEDGSVSLYWKTGPMSLEVEVSADGPNYLWARDETGEIHCLEDDRKKIVGLAKNIVLRMGIRAKIHNPRWRQQYLGNE